MHDYSDYTKPTSEDALAELSRLAEQQLSAQSALAEAEELVKTRKEELRQIAEVQVPELMESLGIETFTTTSGLKVGVTEKVRASMIAAKKLAALKWLRENGHGALIKRIVKVQFGMGEDELAQETIEKLAELPVEDNSSVHAQTLAKFVKTMLESGQDVPEELFSVHRQRVSTIKT